MQIKKIILYSINPENAPRELKFEFGIEEKDDRKISVYLKDFGSIDDEHYFWTRTQVNKLPKLLEMLKQIK